MSLLTKKEILEDIYNQQLRRRIANEIDKKVFNRKLLGLDGKRRSKYKQKLSEIKHKIEFMDTSLSIVKSMLEEEKNVN